MNYREDNLKPRSLKAGSWYWVSKVIIQKYTSRVGCAGISVYHFMASMVDENQCCFPSQKYIASNLGVSRATVNRAVKKLSKAHLIRVDKKSRYHVTYCLLQIPEVKNETQVSHGRNSNDLKSYTNKNDITIHNNNNVTLMKDTSFKGLIDLRKEELLARELAESLDDQSNLKAYLSLTRAHTETFLRQILSIVKQTPIYKIKKSRGALFTYLIKFYAKK